MMYQPQIGPEQIKRAGQVPWLTQEIMDQKHKERKDLLKAIKARHSTSFVQLDQFTEFDVADACVWIDPLDGTNNFVKGNFDCVTCIIGLTIKGESRIGVVHNEYFDINTDGSQLVPRTFFATVEHGLYVLDKCETLFTDEYWSRQAEYIKPVDLTQKPQKPLYFGYTGHHDTLMKAYMLEDDLQVAHLGGAGNKAIHVALGNIDAYLTFYLDYWDLCGGDVLVRA